MDWRQMAGRPTSRSTAGDGAWHVLNAVWSGGRQVGREGAARDSWEGGIDPMRGWVIALCWMIASTVE